MEITSIFFLSLVNFKTPVSYQGSQITLSRRALRTQRLSFKSRAAAKPEWELQARILRGCFPSSACYLALQGAEFTDNIYLVSPAALGLLILNHSALNGFID